MDYVSLIQTLGFPIFVVVWFMFRTEKVLTSNTKAIQELTTAIIEKKIEKKNLF